MKGLTIYSQNIMSIWFTAHDEIKTILDHQEHVPYDSESQQDGIFRKSHLLSLKVALYIQDFFIVFWEIDISPILNYSRENKTFKCTLQTVQNILDWKGLGTWSVIYFVPLINISWSTVHTNVKSAWIYCSLLPLANKESKDFPELHPGARKKICYPDIYGIILTGLHKSHESFPIALWICLEIIYIFKVYKLLMTEHWNIEYLIH